MNKLDFEPIESFDLDSVLRENKKTNQTIKDVKNGRLTNLKCPVCGSTSKEHITKSNNNGILGPGYHSWITDEYFVCKKCGVMFKNIKNNK